MDVRRVTALILCFLLTLNDGASAQGSSGYNIYERMANESSLSTFAALIRENLALQGLYSGTTVMTVFAPNDTAFANLPVSRRNQIMSMSSLDKRHYIQFYTVRDKLLISQIEYGMVRQSMAPNSNKLFFNRKTRNIWQSGTGGTSGTSSVYVNGARVITEGIQCANGIIHVIDNVLDMTSTLSAYEYIKTPDDRNLATQISEFFNLMLHLYNGTYSSAIDPLTYADKVTLFVPTNAALNKIPRDALTRLQDNPQKLAEVIEHHYIKDAVVYTSWVENNQHFPTAYQGSRGERSSITFRKKFEERVYINSGGVTASLVRGNITVSNGVIHITDTLFDYIYFTAIQQMEKEASSFVSYFIARAPQDIQSFLSADSLNMFVPTNEAIARVQNLSWLGITTNQSLIDFVVRLHMLREGSISVTQMNGDFRFILRPISRYMNSTITVYNSRKETWVNGWHTLAMITKPDVAVTNGRLQFIDGVLGVPYKDITSTVYEDDWLLWTYYFFVSTGLNDFLKDLRISDTEDRYGNPKGAFNWGQWGRATTRTPYYTPAPRISYQTCGNTSWACEFTMFVPNGTAIDTYQLSPTGYQVMKDNERFRWVLRRHILKNELLFMEGLELGYNRTFRAHNGDDVIISKVSQNTVRLSYGTVDARVLIWDIGCTNGVIHIIDQVLSMPDDTHRDISVTPSMPDNTTHQDITVSPSMPDDTTHRDISGAESLLPHHTLLLCLAFCLLLLNLSYRNS